MKAVIDDITERINMATNKARSNARYNGDVTLIAVSKTHPIQRILEAQSLGLSVFGENKVQELVDKYPQVKDVSWHLIGNLQRNKVKYIVDKVEMIHSVDSLELAKEIDRRAATIGRNIKILVQINIGREPQKGGILIEQLEVFTAELSALENLVICGLMAIPPVDVDQENTRGFFKEMYEMYQIMKKFEYKNFDINYLSMGMTDDYEIAIEEGSNMVRIGTGIFGKRDYSSLKSNE